MMALTRRRFKNAAGRSCGLSGLNVSDGIIQAFFDLTSDWIVVPGHYARICQDERGLLVSREMSRPRGESCRRGNKNEGPAPLTADRKQILPEVDMGI